MVTQRQGVADGLEATLSALDLRAESSAHVAAMRLIAKRMDETRDADTASKLANVFLRQLVELRQWVAPPAAIEDPFDALARSLAAGDGK